MSNNLDEEFESNLTKESEQDTQDKVSKKEADYRPHDMVPQYVEYDINCGTCQFFKESGNCELVKGNISSDMMCGLYRAEP